MKSNFVILQPIRFWKEDPLEGIEFLPLFFLFIGITAAGVWFIQKRNRKKADLWHLFMNYGLKQGLDPQELNILKNFYDSLSGEDRRSIIQEKKGFYKKLFVFLSESKQGFMHDKTELMARMFQQPGSGEKIEHLRDLFKGEVVYADIDGKGYLCAVTEHSIEEEKDVITFYVRNLPEPESLRKKKIRVYAYRPGHGSYFLDASVYEASENSLRLIYANHSEFKSEERTASDVEFLLRLYPVATAYEKHVTDTEDLPGVNKNQKKKETEFLDGISLKLSGKAVLLELDDRSRVHYDRSREEWELVFVSPLTTEVLTVRGSLFPVPGSKSRFLFRFTETDTEIKNKIAEIIQEFGPRRQNLEQ